MDQHDKQDIKISSVPIITRLDRLEHLIKFVEEKRYSISEKRCNLNPTTLTSLRNMESNNQEFHCKTLSSAIEEVHHKGTLMDRIAMFEKRLLQKGFNSEETYCRKKQKGYPIKLGKRRKWGASISVHYKEWFKWFHMGCSF